MRVFTYEYLLCDSIYYACAIWDRLTAVNAQTCIMFLFSTCDVCSSTTRPRCLCNTRLSPRTTWTTATPFLPVFQRQHWHHAPPQQRGSCSTCDHVTSALRELHWLPVAQRIDFFVQHLVLFYGLFDGGAIQMLLLLTVYGTSGSDQVTLYLPRKSMEQGNRAIWPRTTVTLTIGTSNVGCSPLPPQTVYNST